MGVAQGVEAEMLVDAAQVFVDVLDAVDVDGGAVLPAADAAAVAVEFAVAELIGRLLCAGGAEDFDEGLADDDGADAGF